MWVYSMLSELHNESFSTREPRISCAEWESFSKFVRDDFRRESREYLVQGESHFPELSESIIYIFWGKYQHMHGYAPV